MMVMSMKMPRRTLTYATGGGAGRGLMICIRLGVPISPVGHAWRTRAKFGSKRRLKPICKLHSAALTAASRAVNHFQAEGDGLFAEDVLAGLALA